MLVPYFFRGMGPGKLALFHGPPGGLARGANDPALWDSRGFIRVKREARETQYAVAFACGIVRRAHVDQTFWSIKKSENQALA